MMQVTTLKGVRLKAVEELYLGGNRLSKLGRLSDACPALDVLDIQVFFFTAT